MAAGLTEHRCRNTLRHTVEIVFRKSSVSLGMRRCSGHDPNQAKRVMPMLTNTQIDAYHENGFVGIEGVYSPDEILELQRVTDEFVEQSRTVTENNNVFDLEPGHSAEEPKLRRLKFPVDIHPTYHGALHHEGMLGIVSQLIGDAIRLGSSKLNVKRPSGGSPVEWHQDWTFYPHTNDDLLAVGICIDDMTVENGALLVIPGSHKGPIYDHHHPDGYFCGAVTDPNFDGEGAVPIELKAGGISIHHVRTLHGSTSNRSAAARRLFLLELIAADAWPLRGIETWDAFNAKIVRGTPVPCPRLADVPVRVPYPQAPSQGSIYENQTAYTDRKLK